MRAILRRVGRLEDRFETQLSGKPKVALRIMISLPWKGPVNLATSTCTRFVPQADLASQRVADLIRDRRRRRFEAGGQPFEDLVPERVSPSPGNSRLTVAETLRICRKRRLEHSRALEEGHPFGSLAQPLPPRGI